MQIPLWGNIVWPYFCWGRTGRRGFQNSPKVIPVVRHSVDPMKVKLDVAELRIPTVKNALNNEEMLSFDNFFSYDAMDFPPSLSSSIPTWFIIMFCTIMSIQWFIIMALTFVSLKLDKLSVLDKKF